MNLYIQYHFQNFCHINQNNMPILYTKMNKDITAEEKFLQQSSLQMIAVWFISPYVMLYFKSSTAVLPNCSSCDLEL